MSSPHPAGMTPPFGTQTSPLAESSHDRVIISVMGADRPGIVASLTRVLAEQNVNIVDITQKVTQGLFMMLMIVDISSATLDLAALRDRLDRTSEALGVRSIVQHEKLFQYMHRI